MLRSYDNLKAFLRLFTQENFLFLDNVTQNNVIQRTCYVPKSNLDTFRDRCQAKDMEIFPILRFAEKPILCIDHVFSSKVA